LINEEVAKESIRFAFNISRLTIHALIKGLREAHKVLKDSKDKTGKGQQTVKQLIKQGQGATSLEVSGESMRQFKRLCNKYGLDFAIVKNKENDQARYTVFFKAKDTDAITRVLDEYTAKLMKKEAGLEKPSTLKRLRELKARCDKIPHKNKHRAKEQAR